MEIKGKIALVTGGATGIGRAIVDALAEAGATVAIVARNLERAQAAANEVNGATAYAADVVDETQVNAAFEAIVKAHGRLDVLVNNSGVTRDGLVLRMSDAQWDEVVDTNLKGVFHCCRAAARTLLKQKSGRIVNVSSVVGVMGNPGQANYVASKAGVIGLTKSLGKELATKNILVNCVTPAAANTEIFAQMKAEHIEYMRSKIPMGRFVEVDEIAALVCWLASEDCSFSTGAVFDISGGRATY